MGASRNKVLARIRSTCWRTASASATCDSTGTIADINCPTFWMSMLLQDFTSKLAVKPPVFTSVRIAFGVSSHILVRTAHRFAASQMKGNP